MLKPLEIALIGVGGLSLFSVCFVGFASVAGVPMHTLPVVGSLYEEPLADHDEPAAVIPDPTAGGVRASSSTMGQAERRVVQDAVASLASWTLPPPFEIEELGRLVEDLREGRDELGRRKDLLDSREVQIADEYDRLQKRSLELDQMRRDLEQREGDLARDRAEIEQLAQDLDRSDLVRDEQVDNELLRKSLLFKSGDIDEAAERLTAFPANEAALILHKLGDEDRAIDILNALPREQWKEYVDAFSAVSG